MAAVSPEDAAKLTERVNRVARRMATSHMGNADDLVFRGPLRRFGVFSIVLREDTEPAWMAYRDLAAVAIDALYEELGLPEIPK